MKPLTLSIAAVERDTGLSKDTLRVWERRYGFPVPDRDATGERAYPLDQVEKLRVVKRLLDGGHRPGRVVPMPMDALLQLSESSQPTPASGGGAQVPLDLRPYLHRVRSHDLEGLRRDLSQDLMRLGISRFVMEVVVPLNTLIGDTWMRGQLEIFEEHAYVETLQVVLRSGLAQLPPAIAQRPRVLLTTFPGEPHGLGLLMAESVMALEGAHCISLGVQTPLWDISRAAQAFGVDVVALAFTGCMNPNQIVEGLTDLRKKTPASMAIWAGGSAPALHRRPVDGVLAVAGLHELPERIDDWRQLGLAASGPGRSRTVPKAAE